MVPPPCESNACPRRRRAAEDAAPLRRPAHRLPTGDGAPGRPSGRPTRAAARALRHAHLDGCNRLRAGRRAELARCNRPAASLFWLQKPLLSCMLRRGAGARGRIRAPARLADQHRAPQACIPKHLRLTCWSWTMARYPANMQALPHPLGHAEDEESCNASHYVGVVPLRMLPVCGRFFMCT